jgi:hypothetical protein
LTWPFRVAYGLDATAWEAAVITRQAAVAALGALVREPFYQLAGAVIIYGLALAANERRRPLVDKKLHHRLAALQLAALFVTITVAVLYLRTSSAITASSDTPFQAVAGDGNTMALRAVALGANMSVLALLAGVGLRLRWLASQLGKGPACRRANAAGKQQWHPDLLRGAAAAAASKSRVSSGQELPENVWGQRRKNVLVQQRVHVNDGMQAAGE